MRVCALLLTVLGAVGVTHADTIEFSSSRRPLTGVTIVEEKLDVVEYRHTGIQQKQSVESSEVANVTYDEIPAAVRQAIGAIDAATTRDEILQAGLELTKSISAVKKRGLAAQLSLRAADTLVRGGDLPAALDLLTRQSGDTPPTRYTPLAVAAKGRWLAFRGDVEAARASFTELAGFGEPHTTESTLRRAMLDEATNPAASLATYERLATELATKQPQLAKLARVRRGRVEIALGKRDSALATFRELIAERAALSPALAAAAWNGLGAALTAREKPSPQELEDALFAHLRVVTQFDTIVEEQPEALYRAGKCFSSVTTEDHLARAKHLFRRCQREFPETEWGKKAAEG